jgi:hypothetical protein
MERKDKDRDKEGVLIDERRKRVLEPNNTTVKIAWASSVYSLRGDDS